MIERIKSNKVLLLIIVVLSIGILSTLGRFIYNEIKQNYFLTRNFYFESDKLRDQTVLYQINNYNGVDSYDILINMNSIKNNKIKASEDITYDIDYVCSTNANCSLTKTSGTIHKATGTDYFTLSISPKVTLNDGDSLIVEIVTDATSPYEKTLRGTFQLVVGNYGLSFEIKDSVNKPYLELKVTNTLDYYKVLTAFNSYAVGTKLDIETYLALSQINKDKCASAIINLSFNPNIVLFDNLSVDINDRISQTTTNIGGHAYINTLSFKIDAISSRIVRFYKKNASNNYTYPITNPSSIVTVTYTL